MIMYMEKKGRIFQLLNNRSHAFHSDTVHMPISKLTQHHNVNFCVYHNENYWVLILKLRKLCYLFSCEDDKLLCL